MSNKILNEKLYMGNSGTSVRFIIPLLMLLKGSFIIEGDS